MKNQIYQTLWNSFFNLIFPKYCATCKKEIGNSEEILCLSCLYNLPYTEMIATKENSITTHLLTRLKTENAFALLYFVEGGMVRELLHQLKYNNQPEIGIFLGKLMAKKINDIPWIKEIDCILPIPLHPRKKSQRGYNQSEMIARGLGLTLDKPVYNNNLIRVKNTDSQTNKNRDQRRENVLNAFEVKNKENLSGKHLLLIDDVFTTGATMTACGQAIRENTNCKISVASIAIPIQ
ncbi:MAG TPA: ComF family protein [Edaphocola sp.]|nr:ComF family protein [Edaphocola sp.]